MTRETVRRFNGYRFIRNPTSGRWEAAHGRITVRRINDYWAADVIAKPGASEARDFPSFIDACDWATVALESMT